MTWLLGQKKYVILKWKVIRYLEIHDYQGFLFIMLISEWIQSQKSAFYQQNKIDYTHKF